MANPLSRLRGLGGWGKVCGLLGRGFEMRNSLKFAVFVVCLFGAQWLLAQQKTVKDGVFTQAQVDAGKPVYESVCRTCHDQRFYRDSLRSWNNQPLLWFWESILGTMPADNPGSLMYEEYTDVVAYILAEQGFPTGETPLDPDNGMDEIHIVQP